MIIKITKFVINFFTNLNWKSITENIITGIILGFLSYFIIDKLLKNREERKKEKEVRSEKHEKDLKSKVLEPLLDSLEMNLLKALDHKRIEIDNELREDLENHYPKLGKYEKTLKELSKKEITVHNKIIKFLEEKYKGILILKELFHYLRNNSNLPDISIDPPFLKTNYGHIIKDEKNRENNELEKIKKELEEFKNNKLYEELINNYKDIEKNKNERITEIKQILKEHKRLKGNCEYIQ